MAEIVKQEIVNGETINHYASGAVYNLTRGHFIGAPKSAQFTPETSRKAKERLAELKREAVLRGAAKALDKDDWDMPNALDVVEAISEAVTIKALNPDNAKQVDAARFIYQEAGIAESHTKTDDSPQQLSTEIMSAIEQILGLLTGDIVNATATDIRNEIEGK